YRGTIEEQDDTIIWMTLGMKGAGADLALLLRGNAVNYGVTGQDASGLSFGAEKQTNPPQIPGDLAKLMEKGVPVYFVEEDSQERGIPAKGFLPGLKPVSRAGLPRLFEEFQQVWHW
ncbi:MAG: hypothetical protein ACE5H3_10460, partial [Planctomycetota bacterium]